MISGTGGKCMSSSPCFALLLLLCLPIQLCHISLLPVTHTQLGMQLSLQSASLLSHAVSYSFRTLLFPCYGLFCSQASFPTIRCSLKLFSSLPLPAAPSISAVPLPLSSLGSLQSQASHNHLPSPALHQHLPAPSSHPAWIQQKKENRCSSLQHLVRRRAHTASGFPEESSQGKGKLLPAGAWPVHTEPSETFTSRKSQLMCKLQFTNSAKFRHVFKKMARGSFLLQISFPDPLYSISRQISRPCSKCQRDWNERVLKAL